MINRYVLAPQSENNQAGGKEEQINLIMNDAAAIKTLIKKTLWELPDPEPFNRPGSLPGSHP